MIPAVICITSLSSHIYNITSIEGHQAMHGCIFNYQPQPPLLNCLWRMACQNNHYSMIDYAVESAAIDCATMTTQNECSNVAPLLGWERDAAAQLSHQGSLHMSQVSGQSAPNGQSTFQAWQYASQNQARPDPLPACMHAPKPVWRLGASQMPRGKHIWARDAPCHDSARSWKALVQGAWLASSQDDSGPHHVHTCDAAAGPRGERPRGRGGAPAGFPSWSHSCSFPEGARRPGQGCGGAWARQLITWQSRSCSQYGTGERCRSLLQADILNIFLFKRRGTDLCWDFPPITVFTYDNRRDKWPALFWQFLSNHWDTGEADSSGGHPLLFFQPCI